MEKNQFFLFNKFMGNTNAKIHSEFEYNKDNIIDKELIHLKYSKKSTVDEIKNMAHIYKMNTLKEKIETNTIEYTQEDKNIYK